MQFLVELSGQDPRTLRESIRQVQNASLGFRQDWLAGNAVDAYETSQEAFVSIEYIVGELLRHRDVANKAKDAWLQSPFKAALDVPVGQISDAVTLADIQWFKGLPMGAGRMPACAPLALTFGEALNKLKHRDTIAVNFALPLGKGHLLYVLTKAGMGKPDTLSEIDIFQFCTAGKAASAQL